MAVRARALSARAAPSDRHACIEADDGRAAARRDLVRVVRVAEGQQDLAAEGKRRGGIRDGVATLVGHGRARAAGRAARQWITRVGGGRRWRAQTATGVRSRARRGVTGVGRGARRGVIYIGSAARRTARRERTERSRRARREQQATVGHRVPRHGIDSPGRPQRGQRGVSTLSENVRPQLALAAFAHAHIVEIARCTLVVRALRPACRSATAPAFRSFGGFGGCHRNSGAGAGLSALSHTSITEFPRGGYL